MRLIFAIIAFSLIGISTLFGQNDTAQINQTKDKINELNQRLDKLYKSSQTIERDSVQYKLDMLFEEVKAIKSSMAELKETVEILSGEATKDSSMKELEDKISDIQKGKYYVVLASERDMERIKMVKKNMSNQQLLLVQNKKGSWYHLVLDKEIPMREAIQQTLNERQNGVKDAWWVSAKKLKLD